MGRQETIFAGEDDVREPFFYETCCEGRRQFGKVDGVAGGAREQVRPNQHLAVATLEVRHDGDNDDGLITVPGF